MYIFVCDVPVCQEFHEASRDFKHLQARSHADSIATVCSFCSCCFLAVNLWTFVDGKGNAYLSKQSICAWIPDHATMGHVLPVPSCHDRQTYVNFWKGFNISEATHIARICTTLTAEALDSMRGKNFGKTSSDLTSLGLRHRWSCSDSNLSMSVKCCIYQDSSTAIPAKESAYGRELLAVISHPITISQKLTRLLGHPPGWLTIECFLHWSIQSLSAAGF